MPLHKRINPKLPRRHEVGKMYAALRSLVITDGDINIGKRVSEKGFSHIRLFSSTNKVEWSVDVYPGQYFIVKVGNRLSEECNSVISVVGFLRRMLK